MPLRPRAAAALQADKGAARIVQRRPTTRGEDAQPSVALAGSANHPVRGFGATTRKEIIPTRSEFEMPETGSGQALAAAAPAPERAREGVAP